MARSSPWLTAVTALALTALAHAADPQLGRLAPCGGRRGTELDVVLAGARLGDARELFCITPESEWLGSSRRRTAR